MTNGVGGTNQVSYYYAGARVHQLGRGFLGFRQLTAWEVASSLLTSTYYEQTDRWTSGMAVSTGAWQQQPAGWRQLKQATNTLATIQTVTSSPVGSVKLPYVSASVESAHDLNSGALVTKVTTTQAMDTYGNPTSIVVSTNDGFSKTTTSTYTNDAAKWHLGRLTRAVVVSKATGKPDVTRASSFTYDPTTGLLASETIESDGGKPVTVAEVLLPKESRA